MFCKVKDIDVYYEIHGEGFPIIMVHGYYPDHRLMTGCMEPVFTGESGWQRIYLDLPGMGQTKGPAWLETTDQMLDVVLDFIYQVIPNQPFLVAGESYGGYIARGLIHQRPEQVKGACLICPMIEPDSAMRVLPEFEVRVRDEKLMASLSAADREQFESMAIVQSERAWQLFREDVLPGVLAADSPFLEHLRSTAYGFSFPVDRPAHPFAGPALFFLGRQDTAVGYRDAWSILENYPHASFVILDSAGHNAQCEQEEIFHLTVREWLQRAARYLKE